MFIQSNFSDKWESGSEEELWEAFCEDNREALSKLFLRYYEQLFRYGMGVHPSQDLVKDSIQKLFFRLWKKRKIVNTPQSIQAYLYVSLRRIMLRMKDKGTSRAQRNSEYLDMDTDSLFSIEEQIILKEEQQERKKLLRCVIESLTPRQKEVLLLRIDSGMSNREIACITGVSDKRVRNLIYEATKRLREEIYKLTD